MYSVIQWCGGIRGYKQGHVVVRGQTGLQGDVGRHIGPRADTESGGKAYGAMG